MDLQGKLKKRLAKGIPLLDKITDIFHGEDVLHVLGVSAAIAVSTAKDAGLSQAEFIDMVDTMWNGPQVSEVKH